MPRPEAAAWGGASAKDCFEEASQGGELPAALRYAKQPWRLPRGGEGLQAGAEHGGDAKRLPTLTDLFRMVDKRYSARSRHKGRTPALSGLERVALSAMTRRGCGWSSDAYRM